MKLKTTVRYSESIETVTPHGLKKWRSIDLIEEHDAEADREEIYRDIKEQVKDWHKEANPSTYFNPENTLPSIDIKER